MNKQEAIDALECYRRNAAHILGDNDEKVKTIETCIMLVREAEEAAKWVSVAEERPKLTQKHDELRSSDRVLCVDSMGNYVICEMWDGGRWYDGYGEFRDIVKWMPLPKEG